MCTCDSRREKPEIIGCDWATAGSAESDTIGVRNKRWNDDTICTLRYD